MRDEAVYGEKKRNQQWSNRKKIEGERIDQKKSMERDGLTVESSDRKVTRKESDTAGHKEVGAGKEDASRIDCRDKKGGKIKGKKV